TRLFIDHRDGDVVGFFHWHHTPVHPGLKIALIVGAPTPHGSACTEIALHRIQRIHEMRAPRLKTTAPAAPFRMIRITQSIPQKIKPGWSVTFLQDAMWIGGGPGFQRIGRPERTMPTLDMSLNPVQRRQRFITPQVHPAEHGIPFILPFDGLIEDIKHPRKHRKHFIEYSVLISDVVYSYSSDKFLISFRISGILHLPQGLKKIGLSTPNNDINRSIILLIHHLDDPV